MAGNSQETMLQINLQWSWQIGNNEAINYYISDFELKSDPWYM